MTAADAPPPAAAPAPLRARRWPRRLALALGGMLALAAGMVALAWALLATATGTRWLIEQWPHAQVEGIEGTLLGDLRVRRLHWQLGSRQWLTLTDLRWEGARLTWTAGAAPQLQLRRLTAASLRLTGSSDDSGPLRLPASLVLPLGLLIDEMTLDTLALDVLGDQPVRDLRGRFSASAGPAGGYRLDDASARWDQLQARASARLGAAAPLLLDASVQLLPVPGSPAAALGWRAQASTRGPLARLPIQAEIQARDQSLSATAVLEVQAPLPVSSLLAQARDLDLQALASALPRTALSGQVLARLDSQSAGRAAQPLSLQVDLGNRLADAWDRQGLPVRQLVLRARSHPGAPQTGSLEQLTLTLGSAQRPAGQVQAQGRWQFAGATGQRRLAIDLESSLTQLQPALLDRRAPALQLGGPLALQLDLPLDAPAPGATAPEAAPTLGLRTELTGRLLEGRWPAARLAIEAQASPQDVQLTQLEARAGDARLRAHGRLQRQAQAWHLRLDSQLQRFDPLLWWPVAVDHPWRRQATRLDGHADVDLQLPVGPTSSERAATHWGDRLAALRGQASLVIDPSWVAGVPVTGTVELRSTRERAALGPRPQVLVDARLAAGVATAGGPTELQLRGEFDPNRTRLDRWQLQWSSPALEVLAPWWTLVDANRPPRLEGDTSGQLDLSGRWPQGRLQLLAQAGMSRALRYTPGGSGAVPTVLERAQLRAQAGLDGADRLDLQASLGRLVHGAVAVSEARASGDGSTNLHQLVLDARIEQAPAAAAAAAAGSTSPPAAVAMPASAAPNAGKAVPVAAGTNGSAQHWQLHLRLQGGAELAPAEGRYRWEGQASELSWTDTAQPPNVWATLLGPAPLDVAMTPARWRVHAGSTRLALLDARLNLQDFTWQEGRGDASDAPPSRELNLQAQLEPLTVAPLLARAQPGFGWRGDLQLGGRIDLRASPTRVSAQAELARLRGDLVVADPDNPAGPQRLGLEDLRLSLEARDGVWTLVQRVAGGNLGRLEGEQTLQAGAAALWPPAQAPVRGHIDLRIDQLGNWGRWLPPGWRLSGQLDTRAAVSGRAGAPEFSGELVGQRIAVRNPLQGVDWRNGQVHITLDGDTAQIRQASVQAGSGRLSATGTMQLGAAPRLSAQLQAERFAAQQRVDRRVVGSGQASLLLDARTLALKGAIVLDEGRFDYSQGDGPSLGDDVTVDRDDPAGTTPERNGSASARGPRLQQQLDLRINLGRDLRLTGHGLATRLTGELRLTTPTNKLAINGTIRTEDGTYTAYGQKLTIDRGQILFTGVADNPRLDIEATRPDIDDYRVGVQITGTAQSPHVRLFSEPSLSDTDKLSYLVLGRASDGLGRTDLAMLQRAAFALVTGNDDSPSLLERIGLDTFAVRKEETTTDTRETIVSLGKQLSRRWYLGYERSLNATSGSWQLIYRVAQRYMLRAQTGAENALDLIWTWKWGPPPPAGAVPPVAPAASR